jgi:hypothetical protein
MAGFGAARPRPPALVVGLAGAEPRPAVVAEGFIAPRL